MYAICKSQPAWCDHNIIFDVASSHFDGYCMLLTYHHEWLPPVLPFCHCPHAPACHCLPLVPPEHSNDWEEEPRVIDGSKHFSQNSHYIHDDTIDAYPGLHLNNAQDSDDDLSAISNTKEFHIEQDKGDRSSKI
jgi:hypothetical protein